MNHRKFFFKVFRKQPASVPVVVATSLPDSPALKRLAALGFDESEISALVEDFLSMQCRVNPLSMRERLKKQWREQEILLSSSSQVELAAALESTVNGYVTERAARACAYDWMA